MCSTVEVGEIETAQAAVDVALTRLQSRLDGAAPDISHDQLATLVAELTRARARCDALLLAAVGEVDARGTCVLDGALTTGAWLRAVAHETPGRAARIVRTARTLRSGLLPNTAAALTAGAISGAHATVIADATRDAPAGAVALIEAEAVQTATEGDVRATANLMRAFQHALDPDAADGAAVRRYDRAGITLSPTLSGTAVISGSADESTAAVIAAAVHAAGPPVRGDTRTASRRRLDALADICRHWLDSPGTASAGRTGRHRNQLVVTLDAFQLAASPPAPARAQAPAGTGTASPGGTLTWAGPITASTARRLGCDSLVTFVTLGPGGQVVEAGTQRRYFGTAKRAAMIARDGDTCCAPFCDRPVAWSDGHHLVPVASGGPTTVANGALPCEAHHLMLHEGHWQLQRLPVGRYRLVHPATGKTLGPEPPRAGHSRPPPQPPD